MSSRGRKRWFFSLLLLISGVMLLLLNLGVISLEITMDFVNIIPILLVLIGLKWLVDSFSNKSFGKLLFGLFSLVYGSLIFLDKWNKVNFDYGSWWKLWPLFIIAIAIRTVMNKSLNLTVTVDRSSDRNEDKTFKGREEGSLKTVKKNHRKNFIIGEIKYSEPNWALEPMNFQNVVGDYYFDFSKAFIPEGETPIVIKGWVGDVKVIIPENIPVDIEIDVKVGEVKLFDQKSAEIRSDFYYRSPGYEESSKKIKLLINIKVASIRVSEV
ncbi:cell wall-active antibiotics response protein LiaF [Rossellomorea aquimaris]|nr:cell wall-active antibiotics response protein LiaF [Rossellomorea aquimaris]